MFKRLLLAILCGACIPTSGHAQNEEPSFGIIDELIEANPDKIEAYCKKIISGEASYEDLSKALPYIKKQVTDDDYCSTDRIRIRDSLKSILFHAQLEHTAYINLRNIIMEISEP